ncbi:PilC/PilY family type IV pilus protein [Acinetobacter populi]
MSSIAKATDLQIYAKPTAGQKTIVMMLDTSGSMGSVNSSGYSYRDDYNLNCGTSGQTVEATNGNNLSSFSNNSVYYINSTTTPSYRRRFCYVSSDTSNSQVTNTSTGCEKQSNGAYRCYDRLTRLKDGMFTFLNSANSQLNSVRVGLGNYSVDTNGDGYADANAGRIIVPAVELGSVDSSHRTRLREAVAGLTAYNGTPTANAYAEAASYLMGTSTLVYGDVKKDIYKKITTQSTVRDQCLNPSYPYLRTYSNQNNNRCYANANLSGSYIAATSRTVSTDNYYQCRSWQSTDFDDLIQQCNGRAGTSSSYWTNLGTSAPNLNGLQEETSGSTVFYTSLETQTETNSYSGFSVSDRSTQNDSGTLYKSPLPSADKRQSCDGQGVYILSDGVPTNTVNTRVLATALNQTSFSCSGGLSGGTNWDCMSNFSKRLFDANQNPSGVSIQTAFVGFGAAMNNLGSSDAINACKLSSRTQDKRSSNDACSPDSTTYPVSKPGYGNGGFFIANSADDVTNSVITFINNLDSVPIEPLSTGAVSIPVDALNPSAFQEYGYLRALQPNPGTQNIIWLGNLKKYKVENGVLEAANTTVFDSLGKFNSNTKDLWNNTANSDGGEIELGGVYSRVILPTTNSMVSAYRPLFTNISSVTSDGTITSMNKKASLLSIAATANNSTALLDRFKSDDKLKNLTLTLKLKLLNYFGYDLNLSTTTELPKTLTAPDMPFNAMGASIHSFPIQMTYSGKLDENGNLESTRSQSILYGSMEGALRVVDAASGVEQMVFIPAEILKDNTASKALRKGESDVNGVTYGVSGAWVADSAYQVVSADDTGTQVKAKQMNVYGGMRMGGNSYYGLDLLNPTSPKLLFRVGSDISGFERMGQTWSKPVIANVRYNNKITRVMIVGGGYDICYENPRFRLGTTNPTEYGGGCNKSEALGNAIYIIDADTGERLWWASNTGANTNNTNMKYSIVSRVSTLDRNADGLVDHLYFGDLGGQVFRIDLNNEEGTSAANFGKRVVRLADLGTTSTGAAITNGDQPRFYQPPTITVHDEGTDTFVVVGLASGDRSTPLDVSPVIGRESMLPSTALSNRPTNKVYGLIDRDISNKDIIKGSSITLKTENIKLNQLKENPQTVTGQKISSLFFPYTQSGMQGWYRSLSSNSSGKEVAGRTAGGMKAFEEEPIAITGRLIMPVYDPEGTGIAEGDPCQPRIVGETDVQQFCLPYGACLNSNGFVDSGSESKTGFQISDGKNQNILGAGIRGISFAPGSGNSNSFTIVGNIEGKGEWLITKILNPTRWYEKYVEAK